MSSVYYGIISITSNVLGIIGYLPELYSTLYDVEVKITTKMWIIWIGSGFLGISYGVCIENPYVTMSSSIGTGMNIILFCVKKWKAQKIQQLQNINSQDCNETINNSTYEDNV